MILGESRWNQQRSIGEIEQSLAAGFSSNPVMSQHQYQQNPSVLRTQHYTYHKETITIQQPPPHHITHPFHLPPSQIRQPSHYYHEEIIQQNIRIDPSYLPPPPPSSNNSILIPPTHQLRPHNISDDNSLENVERHDPLFYGVQPPEIPEEVVQREPEMFFGREERDGEVYGLRIFEKTPWWVLMIVFLVCLLLFGVLITWMFQRKKKVNLIEGVLERVSIGGGSVVKSPLVIPPVIPPVVVQKNETVVQPPLKQVKQQKTEVITPVETSPKQLAKEQKLIAKTVVDETPSQPPAVVEQKIVKQETTPPVATVVPVAPQHPVLTKVVEKEEKPTVIGLVCGKDSFSFNGKCYFCPSDQEWNGTNCVLKQAKHLKRWAGKRKLSYDNLQTC